MRHSELAGRPAAKLLSKRQSYELTQRLDLEGELAKCSFVLTQLVKSQSNLSISLTDLHL